MIGDVVVVEDGEVWLGEGRGVEGYEGVFWFGVVDEGVVEGEEVGEVGEGGYEGCVDWGYC